MSSGGIGLLVTLLIRMRRDRQQLRAFGMSKHCERMVEATQVNQAIRISDTDTTAIAASHPA